MLTSDLLVSRITRGKIKPEYADFSSSNLELAALLIETFEQHVGKPYGNLLAELEGYEEMNYRFIRGLSQLLGRRAVIETDAAVDPTSARTAVFEACGGMALSPAERKKALKIAAEKLSISVPELEKALWADLEENQVLKSFETISPPELLRKYNISLTQTLLFKAVDLDIRVRDNYQKLLRAVLRFGLMYTLEDAGETGKEAEKGVHLHLDGPASLFRMSERYGNSFARLFPLLLKSKGWELSAGILHKGYQGKRILEFTLEDSEGVFGPLPGETDYPERDPIPAGLQVSEGRRGYGTEAGSGAGFEDDEEGPGIQELTESEEKEEKEKEEVSVYDSSLEKEFGSLSFGSWELSREPTVLKAGKYAFIPDFALQRDGVKVYVEIVGFWTPEYLEKKIGKLKEVREPVVLLINRKLRCSEKDFPARDVIFFEKKIPVYELMQVLRRYEEEKRAEDREKLQDTEIPLSGEVVSLEALAKEKGTWAETLKEVLSGRLKGAGENAGEAAKSTGKGARKGIGDYVLLENYALHSTLLEKVDLGLEKLGTSGTYAGAVKVFEGFGLDRSLYYPVLEHLGYKVSWCGLSEDDARVKKVKGKE